MNGNEKSVLNVEVRSYLETALTNQGGYLSYHDDTDPSSISIEHQVIEDIITNKEVQDLTKEHGEKIVRDELWNTFNHYGESFRDINKILETDNQ